MIKHKITFIIPTKGREFEIERLLNSINEQSIKPYEVIIVNAGEDRLKDVLSEFNNLNIVYLRSTIASLTVQKNMGIERASAKSSLIGFLDDDLVLEVDAVEKMLSFWEMAEDKVGGAGFHIINTLPNKCIFAKSFVGIEIKDRGVVLPSGFNTQFCPVKNTFSVQWLCGGATVWRKKVLDKYKFDEKFKSYGYYEDVEFSYRVGKEYSLFMVSDARVRHLHTKSKVELQKYYFLERIISKGRVYFVKKNNDLSLFSCFLATIMQTMIYFMKGVLLFNSESFARGMGNLVGFLESVGDRKVIGGQNE